MTTKFTKSDVESIIIQEIKQVLSEISLGRLLKVDLTDPKNLQFIASNDAYQKTNKEFSSLMSALSPVIQKYKKIAGPKAVGFDIFVREVLNKPTTWEKVMGGFGYRQRSGDKSIDGAIRQGIQSIFNVVEEMDNQFDELDPYDGFASPGFGRAKSGMDADQAFASQHMSKKGPGVANKFGFPDALVSTFINWLLGVGSRKEKLRLRWDECLKKAQEILGMDAQFIIDTINAGGQDWNTMKDELVAGGLPDNCLKILSRPPSPGPAPSPSPTPSGGGGYCAKFNRFAIKATGLPSASQAVKNIQEILVNLGFSVKKGVNSPFGPQGKGMVQEPQFKAYGIDGKCGPATRAAVKEFQKQNKLSPDGIVGPKTWAAMQAAAKKGKTAKSDSGSSDVIQKLESLDPNNPALERVYVKTKRTLQRALENQDVDRGVAARTINQFLPQIVPNQFGNSMEMVKKQRIMRLSDLVKKGIKVAAGSRDIILGGEVVEDEIRKALEESGLMQESKTYDIKFDKWSKLWK